MNEIKITKKPLQNQIFELITQIELINQRLKKLEDKQARGKNEQFKPS